VLVTCLILKICRITYYKDQTTSDVLYCNLRPTRCNVIQFIFLETALHVSGGTPTHHQERKQLYLQHLVFVTQLLLSAPIVEDLELV